MFNSKRNLLKMFIPTKIERDINLFKNSDSAVAFLHIPKTAGTWFSVYLKQHFKPDEVSPYLYGRTFATDFENTQRRLFAGHFLYSMVYTQRNLYYITILRDPWTRSASQYRSWHNKKNFTPEWKASISKEAVEALEWTQRASFDEFVRSEDPCIVKNLEDVQVRYLTSVNNSLHPLFLKSAIHNLKTKLFFVGIKEFSEESLELFRYQTGSGIELEKQSENISELYDLSLSRRGKDRLLELVQNDMILYKTAVRLFRDRFDQMRMDKLRDSLDIGHVYRRILRQVAV